MLVLSSLQNSSICFHEEIAFNENIMIVCRRISTVTQRNEKVLNYNELVAICFFYLFYPFDLGILIGIINFQIHKAQIDRDKYVLCLNTKM